MDAKKRQEFANQFLKEYCFAVMTSKGVEYSRGEVDTLSNFKRVAEAIGAGPIQVAYVYLAKHMDSIAYYVKSRQSPSGEHINSRLGDAVNYLLIIASLIEEEGKG